MLFIESNDGCASDEDSVKEDHSGMIDNLTGNHLNLPAEAVFPDGRLITTSQDKGGPHGTCFHVARVVSTPSNWKVSLMLCGNQMCPSGRVSTYSDVQGPANQQTSFSGRDDECVAHKLPLSGHIIKKS